MFQKRKEADRERKDKEKQDEQHHKAASLPLLFDAQKPENVRGTIRSKL
ncbi:MAG: hypothetical protein M1419_00615 [Bacteroidetes bacterium]|nr:hypothetical protein [Bacteroidota bacterium]